MKYSKQEITKNQVEYKVEVPASVVERCHQKALHQVGKNVRVAGFRKGHTPDAVLEQKVDPMQLADAELNNAINESVVALMRDEKLKPLDQPEVKVTKYVPAQTIEFTAKFVLMPEVKLGDITKLKTKQPNVKIDDKQIDSVIERLRTNASTKTKVNRAAKLGDEVTIDFKGSVDDKEFAGGSAKGYDLNLGSGAFIPGFEEGIVGHKAGEEFDVNVVFPKDYGAAELANKKAVFKIKLTQVNELKLPELNDAFAQSLADDLKTVADLRRDIKANLLKTEQSEAQHKYEEDLLTELADKSKVEVPDILVKDEVPNMKRRFVEGLSYRNMTLKDYLKQKDLTEAKWEELELKPAAAKRIKNSMVLTALIEQEKITVDPDEVIAKQNKTLEQYNDEKIKEYFRKPEYLAQLNQQLLTEKAIAHLVKLVNKGKK